MTERTRRYTVGVTWTGNRGEGTSAYGAYDRGHEIVAAGKGVIPASSDPAFRGDATRYNPEELLVAALSACHMLWYLHLCADGGVVVTEYKDAAVGVLAETPGGPGRFTEVLLRPVVAVAPGSAIDVAERLHDRAHQMCFIANSVNFPVRCDASVELAGPV